MEESKKDRFSNLRSQMAQQLFDNSDSAGHNKD